VFSEAAFLPLQVRPQGTLTTAAYWSAARCL